MARVGRRQGLFPADAHHAARASPPGRVKRFTPSNRHPSREIARFAASTSASGSGPFMAKKTPPICKNGRQYSHSRFSGATARAVAKANFVRRPACRPPSSARAWTICASSPRRSSTSRRKIRRLFKLSSKVRWRPGRRIFSGTPGKPAPVPTSIRVSPCSNSGNNRMLSKKCLTTTAFGSVIAVKFIFSFHSISSSIYH